MLVAVLGTRPEAIKLGPVIEALRARGLPVCVLSTGQHPDLLAQTHLPIDYTLDIPHDPHPIRYGERVASVTRQWLSENATVGVIVQGDTASAYGGAMGAKRNGNPVIHVEAGIRSGDWMNPWPEEEFRVQVDRVADFWFCATGANAANLEGERRGPGPLPRLVRMLDVCNTNVVGNPGIDALYRNVTPIPVRDRSNTVLVTLHRRESWGEPMRQIVQGIAAVAKQRKDLQFIVPCHPNGQVEQAAKDYPQLSLTAPMPPEGFQHLLARSQAVVTDSGGVQEEAAALGIPCVVARDTTDRPESVESGHAVCVGRRDLGLRLGIEWALSRGPHGPRTPPVTTPFLGFGDGHAADRIADILLTHFGD